ncbi:hypothetical protein FEM48_Zijuj06G0063600 [Ziziphus jujuba var. spinosa]|uniref:Peptidase A1 domain-containing protein n=1 Tax=Ziziphus jujuba var. spinosa TaxID=714518 RepID=A0A978V7N8_ZIZJJ|nr:hypothetical protein FEM48_Zijuj06G0063600 [Ziziphus jujuba var. spinosa]
MITLSPFDMFDDFLFGCGHNNQDAQKYNRIFSYCLPHTSGSTGYLTFGIDEKASSNIKYTSLTTLSVHDSFHGLRLQGIIVGRCQLSISALLFSFPGIVIDSGTVITRLPATGVQRLTIRVPETDEKLHVDNSCELIVGYLL